MGGRIKLIVVNEHTLAYQGQNTRNYNVLHASILKGAPFNVLPEPKILSRLDKVRLASEEDFDEFRVSPKGFTDNPQEYEFA
jgi:hypothetical protein